MTYKLRDNKNRVSPKLRKVPIPKIKSKLYILFRIEVKEGKVKFSDEILGNSKFEIFNNDIDLERGFNEALFHMYYLADKSGYGYDVKVSKVINYGFSQADGVKTKRVKRRGKYYNYTYIKGVKGVVSVSKWTNKPSDVIEQEIKNIESLSKEKDDVDEEIIKNM